MYILLVYVQVNMCILCILIYNMLSPLNVDCIYKYLSLTSWNWTVYQGSLPWRSLSLPLNNCLYYISLPELWPCEIDPSYSQLNRSTGVPIRQSG